MNTRDEDLETGLGLETDFLRSRSCADGLGLGVEFMWSQSRVFLNWSRDQKFFDIFVT